MSKGFFITGTDTGVGKTIIAGAIIRALNSLGTKACGMKPVESGCRSEGGILIPDDGMFLKHIAQMEEPVTLITPCRLASPLAPLPASEIDRIDINITEIKKAFTELSNGYEAVVVEGVGGLLRADQSRLLRDRPGKGIRSAFNCCREARTRNNQSSAAYGELRIKGGAGNCRSHHKLQPSARKQSCRRDKPRGPGANMSGTCNRNISMA